LTWHKVLRQQLPNGKWVTNFRKIVHTFHNVSAGDVRYVGGKKYTIPSDCDHHTVTLYSYYIVEYCWPCYVTHRTVGALWYTRCRTEGGGTISNPVPKEDPEVTMTSPNIPGTQADESDGTDGDTSKDVDQKFGKPEPTPKSKYSDTVVSIYNPAVGGDIIPTDLTPGSLPVSSNELAFDSEADFLEWQAAAKAAGYSVELYPDQVGSQGGQQPLAVAGGTTRYKSDKEGDYYNTYTAKVEKEKATQDQIDAKKAAAEARKKKAEMLNPGKPLIE
jgi:hypothetical protein